jgi:MSHA biogenesis protein MshP
MCREKDMMKFSIKLQRGFSLVTAIFLLVVLGGLGTMMVTFFVAQQQSSALDVMGTRAYQAARAGIEWASFQVANAPPPAGCTTDFAQNTLAGTLAPFTVSVTCSSASAVEGANPPIWIYDIVSSAVSGGAPGNPDYVERVISVKMGR